MVALVLEDPSVHLDIVAVDLGLGTDFITRLGSRFLHVAIEVLLIFVFFLLVRCVYVVD